MRSWRRAATGAAGTIAPSGTRRSATLARNVSCWPCSTACAYSRRAAGVTAPSPQAEDGARGEQRRPVRPVAQHLLLGGGVVQGEQVLVKLVAAGLAEQAAGVAPGVQDALDGRPALPDRRDDEAGIGQGAEDLPGQRPVVRPERRAVPAQVPDQGR